MAKEIARGAEAVLYREGSRLVKDRLSKGYRLPELDRRIRRQRTRHEDSLLERARRAGISVPSVSSSTETTLTMEFIEGQKVKDAFNGMGAMERKEVAAMIGRALGKLHAANTVHGDFTTSNMLLRDTTHKHGRQLKRGEQSCQAKTLYIIDFGLGKYSGKPEDQAVDLYLLYEALKAAHFKYLNEAWQKILKSYREQYSQSEAVLTRLEKIEKRRRYKGG